MNAYAVDNDALINPIDFTDDTVTNRYKLMMSRNIIGFHDTLIENKKIITAAADVLGQLNSCYTEQDLLVGSEKVIKGKAHYMCINPKLILDVMRSVLTTHEVTMALHIDDCGVMTFRQSDKIEVILIAGDIYSRNQKIVDLSTASNPLKDFEGCEDVCGYFLRNLGESGRSLEDYLDNFISECEVKAVSYRTAFNSRQPCAVCLPLKYDISVETSTRRGFSLSRFIELTKGHLGAFYDDICACSAASQSSPDVCYVLSDVLGSINLDISGYDIFDAYGIEVTSSSVVGVIKHTEMASISPLPRYNEYQYISTDSDEYVNEMRVAHEELKALTAAAVENDSQKEVKRLIETYDPENAHEFSQVCSTTVEDPENHTKTFSGYVKVDSTDGHIISTQTNSSNICSRPSFSEITIESINSERVSRTISASIKQYSEDNEFTIAITSGEEHYYDPASITIQEWIDARGERPTIKDLSGHKYVFAASCTEEVNEFLKDYRTKPLGQVAARTVFDNGIVEGDCLTLTGCAFTNAVETFQPELD